MASKKLPEISDLRNRVIYDAESGALKWMARPVSDFRPTTRETAETRCQQWNSRCAGKPAFASVNRCGYCVGHFRGKLLAAHRVAFAIHEGRWPKMVDHINGKRADNRWANLREVTPSENLMNCAVRSDSTTGRTGVRHDRRKGSGFVCYIRRRGRSFYLGSFETMEAAVAARKAAERDLGFCPNHGRPR